jgi:hypothetical protein
MDSLGEFGIHADLVNVQRSAGPGRDGLTWTPGGVALPWPSGRPSGAGSGRLKPSAICWTGLGGWRGVISMAGASTSGEGDTREGGVEGRLPTVGRLGLTDGTSWRGAPSRGVRRIVPRLTGSARCAGGAATRSRASVRRGLGAERGVALVAAATCADEEPETPARSAASSAGGTDGPVAIWPTEPSPPSPPPAASNTAAISRTAGASAVAPAARAACRLQSRTSSTTPW